MAITPPTWAKGAHPTRKGWMKGSELLKAQSFTQAQIDEWYGIPESSAKPAPKPMLTEIAPVAPLIDESPQYEDMPSKAYGDLETMSKKELEIIAREEGVELDRRLSKRTLLETVKGILK